MVERNEGLGADDSWDHLDVVVEEIHQVLVVACENLDEHRVGTSGEVALNDFGDLFKFGDNLAVHVAALEVDADVGASLVSDDARVDVVAGSGDNVEIDHALDALMYGGTGNAANFRHVLGGDAGVLHNNLKDLSIEIVDFVHVWLFGII